MYIEYGCTLHKRRELRDPRIDDIPQDTMLLAEEVESSALGDLYTLFRPVADDS